MSAATVTWAQAERARLAALGYARDRVFNGGVVWRHRTHGGRAYDPAGVLTRAPALAPVGALGYVCEERATALLLAVWEVPVVEDGGALYTAPWVPYFGIDALDLTVDDAAAIAALFALGGVDAVSAWRARWRRGRGYHP